MRWSIVIPVYNEADFLPRTLASIIAQTTAFDLIIVDNGSTDGCIGNARMQLADYSGKVTFLHEPRPGQVYALQTGIAAVASEFTAICDADTYYPPQYLSTATRLFDAKGANYVAACACLRREPFFRGLGSMAHRLLAARVFPHQNHTSGAAQMFRTDALRAAGSYDPLLWPYVLKDHELMHRVLKFGRQIYHHTLWCTTSDRRADRGQGVVDFIHRYCARVGQNFCCSGGGEDHSSHRVLPRLERKKARVDHVFNGDKRAFDAFEIHGVLP